MEELDVKDIKEIDRLWALSHIKVGEAWKHTYGKGAKVAILDSGASLDHPDLKPNIKGFKDFTGSRHGAEDVNGHGSHVAGIIGAVRDDKGIIGVAPEADLYIAKVLRDNNKGDFQAVIQAIEWAMEMDVDVITMSLGAKVKVPELLHYTVRKAYREGIILLAASGNKNDDVSYPAAYPEVIAVSAVDKNSERADFSNFGISNEISAPGVDILSTYKNKGYAVLSGTSMATPIVSGAVALFVSYYKSLNNGERPCSSMTRRFIHRSIESRVDSKRDDSYGEGVISLENFEETIKNLGNYC